MRIAIITTSWPSSEGDPAGHFVRAEARQLEREGHAVCVLRPRPDFEGSSTPPKPPNFENRARSLIGGAFGWPGVAARVREQPLRAVDAAWWIARARREARPLEVDRVIAHWAIPCAWPIGAASRAVLEVVSHGGDVRLLASMPGALRSRLVRAIASRASAWRFVSAPLMQELLCRLGPRLRAQLERMAVVRPPLLELPDVRAAVERKRGEMAGARVAVIVGRLVASKRVDRAIEYVECSRDVDLLVIVGDGPERARLQRLANARRVDARFMGTVDRPEALAWIGAADLLVHASHAEGLSTVVREAEALGTRVLHLS